MKSLKYVVQADLLILLTAVAAVLKITGLWSISWWTVTVLLWGPYALVLAFIALVLTDTLINRILK